jgi:4a-hydroxytetrahydrobiopterin dehydratase
MDKKDLLKKKCVPCKGGAMPLAKQEVLKYMEQVSGWTLVENKKPKPEQAQFEARISKEFKFQDFIGAINFVERVADVAEMEGHHPDIHWTWNKITLVLWTHSIGGLSENDFIVAAKIDALG